MKIAILTNAYPPDGRGGAERIASLQAEGLASRGHEVRVWAPSEDGGGRMKDGRIVVSRFLSQFSKLGGMSAVSRLIFHAHDLYPRSDVAREIVDWNPDVLITHNLTGCGIGTGSRAQGSGVRWVHVLHDVQLTEPSGQARLNQGLFLRMWRLCWSFLRRRTFGKPDALVSPSKWLLDWHMSFGFHGKKETVLPNPVEMGEVRERTRYYTSTIAFVGRLSEDKGFGDVLKMIPKLDLATVGSIVIVGEGPLRVDAAALGDQRINLRGALEPGETRRVIAGADLLVAPSRIHENQPTVILEAMAEGTPVIATDVGGVRELLEGTGASVIPVAGDDLGDRLANEARVILGDPDRWMAISRALRQRAEERHGMNGHLDRLDRLLV